MQMSSNVFLASAAALRDPTSALPSATLLAHQKVLAQALVSSFGKFAVEICGCSSPSDRVKMRKSVWHQTVGLRLGTYKKQLDQGALITLARMECATYFSAGLESSPSKIVLGSKILRAHFQLNESTTCRGCSKRGKCPFVHKAVETSVKRTSLGAVAKVLFGMSQTSRMFLEDSARFPFVMTAQEMEAAVAVTDQLRAVLQPAAIERQLSQIPIADKHAVKQIIKKQLEKKARIKDEIMKKKEASPSVTKPDPEANAGAEDEDLWVPEEGSLAGEKMSFSESLTQKISPAAIVIDSLKDMPVVDRGIDLVAKTSRQLLVAKKQLININIDPTNGRTQTVPVGGYTLDASPTGAGVEYIKPFFLHGKTALDNVAVASKLWENANEYITDLKFLKRVPYSDGLPGKTPAKDVLLEKALNREDEKKLEESLKRDYFVFEKKVDKEPKKSSKTYSSKHPALADQPKSVTESNTDAVHAALGSGSKQKPRGVRTDVLQDLGNYVQTEKLRFPKLPEWDSVASNKGYRSEYAHLFRPKSGDIIDGAKNGSSTTSAPMKENKKSKSKLPLK